MAELSKLVDELSTLTVLEAAELAKKAGVSMAAGAVATYPIRRDSLHSFLGLGAI